MFLRDKKHRRKDGSFRVYLQIAESYRERGRVKQRVKGTLGRLDELKESGDLESLAEQLSKYAENTFLILVPERDIKIEWSKQYGVVYVFDWLWKKLGLKDIILELLGDKNFGFDVERAIFTLVVNRLIDPKSKLDEVKWREYVYISETDEIREHHLYRAMDFLYESNKQLQEKIFNKTTQLNLFKPEADIILWNTICIRYYEEKGMRVNGLVKVDKPNPNNEIASTQMILGLATTKDGIPIGFEVFRGNMSDQKMVKEILAKMEVRFQIKKVIFVVDRQMSGSKNIELLSKYSYIADMKMHKFNEVSEDILRRPGKYKKVKDNLYIKEVWVGEKRYIIAYNPQEAKHDKEAKEEDCFKGKYVILTNVKELSSEEVVSPYKNLVYIEDSFGELKSTIEPMRHSTAARIETHIMICVLALFLERVFEKMLNEGGLDITAREGIEELKTLSLSKMELKERSWFVRSEYSQLADRIFSTLKVRLPERITPI